MKDKQEVCVTNRNKNENIVYETANYKFIMIIDYIDFLYQSKLLNIDISEEWKLELGETYGITEGNSEISAFFTSGLIETTYIPNIKGQLTFEVMTTMYSEQMFDKFKKELDKFKKTEDEEL